MRDNALHLERGAPVKNSEGKEIGGIDRIVFDAKAQRVTHIVLRKGVILKTDRVIPVDALERSENGVAIATDTDPKAFPKFEQSDYVYDTHSDFYVANPAVAMGPMGPTGAPDTEMRRHRDRNIPEDAIALRANSDVIASDGERIGRINEVVADPADDRTVQIIVAGGKGDRTKHALPASLVTSIAENEIHLGIDSSEVDEYVIVD